MTKQFDIFSFMGTKNYKITKPIKLIELFAGYGSQAMALKRLDIPFEHHFVCEFDKYAIQSYNAVHGTNFDVSDIRNIKAKDLDIRERERFEFIMTYSFPCQDLSLAGKGKGMRKGNGGRSGLLWEVERLLIELGSELPQILLMENVPQVIGTKHKADFNEWQNFLARIGYKNFVMKLNAKDFGVAQNRDRVFMLSILNTDLEYEFPKPFKLEKRLKDYLEDKVDEKYYLTEKQLSAIENPKYESMGIDRIKNIEDETLNAITTSQGGNREPKIAYALTSREFEARGWLDEAPTLTARDYKDPKIIAEPLKVKTWNKESQVLKTKDKDMPRDRIYMQDSVAPTTTNLSQQPFIAIKEATKKGYAEAQDGDGVYIDRPHQKRGCVQKGKIQTIKANGQDVGVVVFKENYSERSLEDINKNIVDKEDVAKTLTAQHQRPTINSATLVKEDSNYRFYQQAIETAQENEVEHGDVISAYNKSVDKSGKSPTITTRPEGLKTAILPITHDLRIRKLTPREAGRLMDVTDDDIDKMLEVISNSQAYKQFGNSIVVNVLVAIFRGLF